MTEVEELVQELSRVQDELLALPDDAFRRDIPAAAGARRIARAGGGLCAGLGCRAGI